MERSEYLIQAKFEEVEGQAPISPPLRLQVVIVWDHTPTRPTQFTGIHKLLFTLLTVQREIISV